MKISLSCWIVVWAVLLGLGGCATKRVKRPVEPAPPTYAERVQERVQEASERELHELRYNPGLCGCPPFELELQGRWHRVTFDVDDDSHPVLVELRAAVELDDSNGTLGRYLIQGRLEDRVDTCGQGAIFLTLDPAAYGPPEPEEPEGESEEPEEESIPGVPESTES